MPLSLAQRLQSAPSNSPMPRRWCVAATAVFASSRRLSPTGIRATVPTTAVPSSAKKIMPPLPMIAPSGSSSTLRSAASTLNSRSIQSRLSLRKSSAYSGLNSTMVTPFIRPLRFATCAAPRRRSCPQLLLVDREIRRGKAAEDHFAQPPGRGDEIPRDGDRDARGGPRGVTVSAGADRRKGDRPESLRLRDLERAPVAGGEEQRLVPVAAAPYGPD